MLYYNHREEREDLKMTVYIINVLDNFALTGWEETLVCTEEEALTRVEELKADGLDAEIVDEYEI